MGEFGIVSRVSLRYYWVHARYLIREVAARNERDRWIELRVVSGSIWKSQT